MLYQTAPRSYFDCVIEEMKAQGFEFMAWVTMNSRKYKYHVSLFDFAQESRLFFRAPKQAFIVCLILQEHFGKKYDHTVDGLNSDYRQSYWRGFIEFAHSQRKWYQYFYECLCGDFYSAEKADFGEHLAACCSDYFRWDGNWIFEQKDAGTSGKLIEPKILTAQFGKMLDFLKPVLHPRFRELQITKFAPYYTFPDQEPAFWKKFPLNRFKGLADRTYGSTFS